jgi:hypothetical protein
VHIDNRFILRIGFTDRRACKPPSEKPDELAGNKKRRALRIEQAKIK